MDGFVKIGIIGDYDARLRSHIATGEALRHAAGALPVSLESTWLPTESLEGEATSSRLEPYDALWCAPGSPYRSMAGALQAIRYARTSGRPFIGT